MSDSPKRCVITGASRGLGLALTREFLKRGHQVDGSSRSGDPFSGNSVERYTYHRVDVTVPSDCQAWAKKLAEDQTTIDYLLHVAGVIHDDAVLQEIDPQQMRQVIEVNVLGAYEVLRAFLPTMLSSQHGVLIAFSSGAGRRGVAEISGYCASKWAVEGMLKSVAKELPVGMAAIPLNPGAVNTDMLQKHYGDKAHDHPAPEDWARVAAPYILTLGAKHNGQSLTVPAEH